MLRQSISESLNLLTAELTRLRKRVSNLERIGPNNQPAFAPYALVPGYLVNTDLTVTPVTPITNADGQWLIGDDGYLLFGPGVV